MGNRDVDSFFPKVTVCESGCVRTVACHEPEKKICWSDLCGELKGGCQPKPSDQSCEDMAGWWTYYYPTECLMQCHDASTCCCVNGGSHCDDDEEGESWLERECGKAYLKCIRECPTDGEEKDISFLHVFN